MLTFAIKMQHGMVHNWKRKNIKGTNLKEFGKFMNHSKNYSNHQKELFKKEHHSPNKGAVTIR